MNLSHKKGFTLIELLIVIAIIGILSAVILTSLSSARGKARVAGVQQSVHALQVGALGCVSDSLDIALPTADDNTQSAPLCNNSTAAYSKLPADWIYCDNTLTTGAGSATNCGNDTKADQVTGTSFSLSAYSTTDKTTVTCTESLCTTVTAL